MVKTAVFWAPEIATFDFKEDLICEAQYETLQCSVEIPGFYVKSIFAIS